MDIFALMNETATKDVYFFSEPLVSLKAIVVINQSILGPSVARCKMLDYPSVETALQDALESAAFTTYSSALSQRAVCGGSMIIMGNPKELKSEIFCRALGNIINKLQGKLYLTGGSGISTGDIVHIKKETNHVLGLQEIHGGAGDIAASIAKGMIWGIKALVKDQWDKTGLEGLKVAVQGVGSVGKRLVEYLIQEKATVVITDIVYDKIKVIQDKFPQVSVVKPKEIVNGIFDIFLSCAYEHSITKDQVDKIQTKILTGSISRFTDTKETEEELKKKGILVIPGFVINSGEVIHLANELENFPPAKTDHDLGEIYFNTLKILSVAKAKNQSVTEVALTQAIQYINDIRAIKSLK